MTTPRAGVDAEPDTEADPDDDGGDGGGPVCALLAVDMESPGERTPNDGEDQRQ